MECSQKHQLGQQPNWPFVGLSVSLSLIIGAVDHAIRLDLSLSIFYLVPVVIAAWYVNRSAGIWMSLLCSVAWSWADSAANSYGHSFLPLWNSGVRLSFFIVVSHLISLQRQAYQKEQQLARKDPLTGLSNRRFFIETLQLEISRSRRYFTPFTLAYLDLDNFKTINDRMGHQVGDRLLRTVSRQLTAALRESDSVGRLGGDEFVILLPLNDPSQAHRTLERVHGLLKSRIGEQWPVGFSMGAITFLESPVNAEDAIAQADKIMYEVKQQGKNALSACVIPASCSSQSVEAVSKISA